MTRVLVVDDDLVVRTLLEEQLTINGYQVTTAINGEEAKRFVIAEQESSPFSIIVTDMKMPQMDGLQFTEFVRGYAHSEKLPVVMLTAETREEDRKNGEDCGVNAYFHKPCQIDKLLETIREQLEKYENSNPAKQNFEEAKKL